MKQSIKYKDHNIKVYVEGQGEAIVFLHGWPSNSQLWKAQVEFFKEKYKVITFDWLGFGQSDKPAEHHYTFSNKKEILDQVLSSVLRDKEQITIVAHDIGGPPAILWASEKQERVNQLILLNTIIYPFSTSLDKLSHFLFKLPIVNNIIMSPFGLKILMNVIMTNKNGSQIRKKINEILGYHIDLSTKVKLKTILEPLENGKKNEFLNLAEKYKNIQAPKQLIIAKKDQLCFAHVNKLSEENPNVPVYLMQDAGHFIPIDKSDKLNEILSKTIS